MVNSLAKVKEEIEINTLQVLDRHKYIATEVELGFQSCECKCKSLNFHSAIQKLHHLDQFIHQCYIKSNVRSVLMVGQFTGDQTRETVCTVGL